ncbi:hypothetical protein F5141DRAFT_1107289 [Pisolithus sp. B1]|nr:hypothetical protein F5141DRAFT_1107289 [Pisolithus sp. B1]
MQFAHSHCHQMYFPWSGATVYHDHSHIPPVLLYRPKDLGCLELRTELTVKNCRRLRLSVAQIEKAGRDLRWTTTSGERKGAARREVTTRTEAWHALFLTSQRGSTTTRYDTRRRAATTMISPQTRGTTSISSDVRFAKIGRQYSDGGNSTMKAA